MPVYAGEPTPSGLDIIRFVDRISTEALPADVQVSDTFTRTAAGLNNVEVGGVAWSTFGSFSTDGAKAIVNMTSVDSSRRAWVPLTFSDQDVIVSFRVPVVPTGATICCGAMGRLLDSTNFYLAELIIGTDSSVTMRIGKFVASNFTSLGTSVIAGLTHATGKTYRVRFQMRGSILRARGWDSAGSEPTSWQVEVTTDTTYGSGNPGFRTTLTAGNTNTLPINIEFDNFSVLTGGTAAQTLRLDLNDGVTWGVNYEGTDFSPPPLKQAWSSTLMTDGERLSAAAYGNRQIQLSMDLMASNQDVVATQLQKLWRELNRPSNILMYQPQGATNPVFFRTLRSSNTRVTDFPAGAMRHVQVTIDAEPFAYGYKETLTPVAVCNDPAPGPTVPGTNRMFFDVTNPKGDVETPLYLKLNGPSIINTPTQGQKISAIAVRRRGNPDNVPFVLQAENLAVGTQTISKRAFDFSNWTTALNANTTFESNVNNWTGFGCAISRSTDQAQAGVASMKLIPDGVADDPYVESDKVPIAPSTDNASSRYVAWASVRCAVSRQFELGINWYQSAANGGGYISTTPTTFTVAANTWVTFKQVQGPAPTNAGQASMYIKLTGDAIPFSGDVTYIDEAEISRASFVETDMTGLSSFTNVISGHFPPLASVDARGTYRVFMRYRYGDTGIFDTNEARLLWGRADNKIANAAVILRHDNVEIEYQDLGVVQIPGDFDPISDGMSGNEIPANGVYFELQVRDIDGSSNDLAFDHFLFVPADDRMMLVRWPTTVLTVPTSIQLDSLNGQVYALDSDGEILTMPGTEIAGGAPMVTPAVTNRIYFCNDVGRDTKSTSKNLETTITAHYWPRYLTVRPTT